MIYGHMEPFINFKLGNISLNNQWKLIPDTLAKLRIQGRPEISTRDLFFLLDLQIDSDV